MAEKQEIELTMIESRKVTEILKKALVQIQTIDSERERWCLKDSLLFEKLTDSLKWYLHYMQKIRREIEQSKFALKELEKDEFRTLTAQAWETLIAILKSIKEHENFLTKEKQQNTAAVETFLDFCFRQIQGISSQTVKSNLTLLRI